MSFIFCSCVETAGVLRLNDYKKVYFGFAFGFEGPAGFFCWAGFTSDRVDEIVFKFGSCLSTTTEEGILSGVGSGFIFGTFGFPLVSSCCLLGVGFRGEGFDAGTGAG